jgi:hypothetical protein
LNIKGSTISHSTSGALATGSPMERRRRTLNIRTCDHGKEEYCRCVLQFKGKCVSVEERYKNVHLKCRIRNYKTAFPSLKTGIHKKKLSL